MAEKLYETCAKQVQIIINQHRSEVDKIGQAVQKINADPRYSQLGKDELIKKLRDELNELNRTKSDELKEVVRTFCNQYQVVHTDDGKADAQVIANALKVIEMSGYNLTVDLLRSVVEPLKNSYTSLKMIRSLLAAKNENLAVGYTPDVLILMDEYIGVNGEIIAYEDTFASVKAVLDMDMTKLVSAGMVGIPEFNGQVIPRLIDFTSYSVLCLGDNMMKVGKLYDSVYLEYPRLFK
jgi:hypothetical protein